MISISEQLEDNIERQRHRKWLGQQEEPARRKRVLDEALSILGIRKEDLMAEQKKMGVDFGVFDVLVLKMPSAKELKESEGEVMPEVLVSVRDVVSTDKDSAGRKVLMDPQYAEKFKGVASERMGVLVRPF